LSDKSTLGKYFTPRPTRHSARQFLPYWPAAWGASIKKGISFPLTEIPGQAKKSIFSYNFLFGLPDQK
jgi:hypothetical protein